MPVERPNTEAGRNRPQTLLSDVIHAIKVVRFAGHGVGRGRIIVIRRSGKAMQIGTLTTRSLGVGLDNG